MSVLGYRDGRRKVRVQRRIFCTLLLILSVVEIRKISHLRCKVFFCGVSAIGPESLALLWNAACAEWRLLLFPSYFPSASCQASTDRFYFPSCCVCTSTNDCTWVGVATDTSPLAATLSVAPPHLTLSSGRRRFAQISSPACEVKAAFARLQSVH